MDCFIVDDKRYTSFMTTVPDHTLFNLSMHVNQHYSSMAGCIRSSNATKKPFYYTTVEDIPDEASSSGKGVRMLIPVKAIGDEEYKDYLDLLLCLSQREVDGQAVADFYVELLNDEDSRIREIYDQSDDKEWLQTVGLKAFALFDYVQRRAMKEKHTIYRFRKKAEERKASENAHERSFVSIGGDCRYSYIYEEKSEITRRINCPLWSVRGHMRHYKSGKTSYVRPYTKDRDRNSDNSGKTYIIKEEV